jgi:DNA-directed RNA polymerase specialized sigma24 family protein
MMLREETMDESQLRALHARILEGDSTALLDVFETVGPALMRQLALRYRVDETWIADAVQDTLFSLVRRPSQYTPDRGTLGHYLRMSAEGDLRNILKREQRRRPAAVVSLDAVADDGDERKASLAEQLADPTVDPYRWLEEVDPVLIETIREELPEPRDRRILGLMVRGARATSDFAEVLGISALNRVEQERQVKRAKDRIIARLKRALQRKGWARGR